MLTAIHASTTVLADASRLGDNILLVIGPLAFVTAIAIWIALTIRAASKRVHPEKIHGDTAHRGPVQGGVLAPDQPQDEHPKDHPHDRPARRS